MKIKAFLVICLSAGLIGVAWVSLQMHRRVVPHVVYRGTWIKGLPIGDLSGPPIPTRRVNERALANGKELIVSAGLITSASKIKCDAVYDSTDRLSLYYFFSAKNSFGPKWVLQVDRNTGSIVRAYWQPDS